MCARREVTNNVKIIDSENISKHALWLIVLKRLVIMKYEPGMGGLGWSDGLDLQTGLSNLCMSKAQPRWWGFWLVNDVEWNEWSHRWNYTTSRMGHGVVEG